MCWSTADASEATYVSPSLTPTSSGEPLRAAMSVSGSVGEATASPYAPSTSRRAAATAATRLPSRNSSIRCANTSESVSERKVWPRDVSQVRSDGAFSMIPLWTIATVPPQSMWGCALRSLGSPWVAHRVCATPRVAWGAASPTRRSRSAIRPATRSTTSPWSETRAMPAESYPRYSSRRSPSNRIGLASRVPR